MALHLRGSCAPYPQQQGHKTQVLGGFEWLQAEAGRRFRTGFADLTTEQKANICDDVCYAPKAKPEHQKAAQFLALYRDLTAGRFFTTREGMAALKYTGHDPQTWKVYTGNTPLTKFDGPPPDVLAHLKSG